MTAQRKSESHHTGDSKMKAAALKAPAPVSPQPKDVAEPDLETPVPSPARALQDRLAAHYQPFTKRMSVVLISLLVGFAFISGWMSGSGSGGLI